MFYIYPIMKYLLLYCFIAITIHTNAQGVFVSTSSNNLRIESNMGKYTQPESENIIIQSLLLTDSIINEVTEDINQLVTISPNPIKDRIRISRDINKIEIFDMSGRHVFSLAVYDKTANLSSLNKGMYFISLFNNNEYVQSIKVLKK